MVELPQKPRESTKRQPELEAKLSGWIDRDKRTVCYQVELKTTGLWPYCRAPINPYGMLLKTGDAETSDASDASLFTFLPLTMAWMKLPMNKNFALAFATLLCFASQSYARHPFVYDAIWEAPSVLVNADEPAVDTAVASDAAVVEQPEVAVESGEIESNAAPMPADEAMVEPGAAMKSESAPVYRSRTSRKSSGGLVNELIQLERRKNAWIRRNIFGR